jgi:stress-induced morphogen
MNADEMKARIQSTYPDSDVAVIDTTGTEDHFDVRIASSHFKGLSRIQQHQSIMKLFDAELKTGEVHALEIKVIVK